MEWLITIKIIMLGMYLIVGMIRIIETFNICVWIAGIMEGHRLVKIIIQIRHNTL